ncbi:MAG: hypothetical protein ACI4WG_01570 [Erysipelotrichaceae bacterium]
MKKVIVCLLVVIMSICLFGCDNNKENNDVITASKQLFMDIDKNIVKSDSFDFKLDESYIVNSPDDKYTFYYYKGYFTFEKEEKLKIDYFEAKPSNFDYFYDVSFNSGSDKFSVLIYHEDACRTVFVTNNTFENISEQMAYCFEFVIASYNDYIEEPFFSESRERFDENMKDLTVNVN